MGNVLVLFITAEAQSRVVVSANDEEVYSYTAPAGPTEVELTLNDGTYEITVVAIDAAGNQSSQGTRRVVIDTEPPLAGSIDATPGTTEEPETALTITGQPDAEYVLELSGPVTETVTGELDSTGADHPAILLPNGSYVASLMLTDPGGDSPTTTIRFTVEQPAPAPPRLRLHSDTGARPIELLAVGEPGSQVRVTLVGESGEQVLDIDLDDAGEGIATFDVGDGGYAVSAVSVDWQQQVSDPHELDRLVVSTTPPPLSVDWTARRDAKAGVDYTITTAEGSRVEVTTEPGLFAHSFTATGDAQSFFNELLDDAVVVRVTAVDSYGNEAIEEFTVAARPIAEEDDSTSAWPAVLLLSGGAAYAVHRRRKSAALLGSGG